VYEKFQTLAKLTTDIRHIKNVVDGTEHFDKVCEFIFDNFKDPVTIEEYASVQSMLMNYSNRLNDFSITPPIFSENVYAIACIQYLVCNLSINFCKSKHFKGVHQRYGKIFLRD
jgi:hypothetical protein